MKTNKFLVFFTLFFFYNTIKSKCDFKNNLNFSNGPQILTCTNDLDKVLIYPNIEEYGQLKSFDIYTLQKLSLGSLSYYRNPIVYNFLQPVETYGGYIDLIGFFFIISSPNTPPDNFTWSMFIPLEIVNNLKRRYIEETQQLIFSYNVPEGICSFKFLEMSFPYQNASIGNPQYTLNSQGNLTIYGSNLNKINITIKDILSSNGDISILNYDLNSNHTIVTFKREEFLYSGAWNVTISQCNKILNPFTVDIQPEILNFTTVPLKGGRLTLTGKYLSKKDTYKDIVINLKKEKNNKVTPCTDVIYQTLNPGGVEVVSCNLNPVEQTQDENTPQTINIDINGIHYTVPSFFVYDQPSITDIKYNGNSEIIIFCKNYINNLAYIKVMVPNGLGDNKGNSLRLGGFEVVNDTEQSDANTNYGIFKATNIPHFAMPGYLTILFDGSNIESPIYNKFMLQPSVSGISNSNTQGGIISIYGSSLFIKDYNNKTIENSFVKINGKDCFQFENGDGSFITCEVGPGTGKQYSFSIRINGIEYNDKLMFSYKPPSIDDFKQNFETNVISILGNNFGDEIGTAMVKFDNEYVNIKTITHNMITMDIKDSFSGNYTIHTLIGDTEHAQDQVIPFVGPVLPLIKNVSNVDCSGGIVTVNGKNLNDKMQINFVATNTIGKKRKPTPCINVKLINSTYAECIVLGKSGQLGNSTTYTSGKNFNVTVENGKKDGNATLAIFSFNPPIIDKVYNFTDSTLQTKRLSFKIDGKNFNRDGLMVYINGNQCKYPFIDSDFVRISCAHESFQTLGIEFNATKLNLELANITVSVDGQTTTKFFKIYNFAETKVKEGSSYGYIAAITVGGLLLFGTVSLILIRKYKRYIRLKKIKENLKKVEREMMIANPNQTIIP